MLLLAQPAACPQHTRTTRHKPLRPEPGRRRRRKGQGFGFTSSDHDAAQIRHQGDTSHHVLCVVTRAPLLLCPLPNSTGAAQATQTMNHVPLRCPLEQQPSLCILMSLRQRGHKGHEPKGEGLRLSDVCLLPASPDWAKGAKIQRGKKKEKKRKDLRTASRVRQRKKRKKERKKTRKHVGDTQKQLTGAKPGLLRV